MSTPLFEDIEGEAKRIIEEAKNKAEKLLSEAKRRAAELMNADIREEVTEEEKLRIEEEFKKKIDEAIRTFENKRSNIVKKYETHKEAIVNEFIKIIASLSSNEGG